MGNILKNGKHKNKANYYLLRLLTNVEHYRYRNGIHQIANKPTIERIKLE